MNDNARKWVEALRSGEFEQDKDALRTPEGYCCLGVACEVYRRKTGEGEWAPFTSDSDSVSPFSLLDEPTVTAVLPRSVRQWLGLADSAGAYGEKVDGVRIEGLAARNDDGASFEEIASIIESEPEGLFQ